VKPQTKLLAALVDAGLQLLDGGVDEGGFMLQMGAKGGLRLRVSWGGGWDHVSVSAGWTDNGATRQPTWDELEAVRRMIFEDTETVLQIHPPIGQYVNIHPHVLHLWRPQDVQVPLPPVEFV